MPRHLEPMNVVLSPQDMTALDDDMRGCSMAQVRRQSPLLGNVFGAPLLSSPAGGVIRVLVGLQILRKH
jgi:hypothetical protein